MIVLRPGMVSVARLSAVGFLPFGVLRNDDRGWAPQGQAVSKKCRCVLCLSNRASKIRLKSMEMRLPWLQFEGADVSCGVRLEGSLATSTLRKAPKLPCSRRLQLHCLDIERPISTSHRETLAEHLNYREDV
jgi:hypothetical protein